METTPEQLSPWGHIIAEIDILSEIARANGSLVSLKDLAALTRTTLSEEQIESSWAKIPELAATYELKNGLIIQRDKDYATLTQNIADLDLEKRVRAENYTRLARKFAYLCNAQETKLLAISGSTSYKTPTASDDLDIFCVTKLDKLWLFITKSLLMARVLRILKRDFPRICFSYAADQRFAEKEFLLQEDALFARDALTTIVIHGQDYYTELLKNSSWISNYFPRLYRQRTNTNSLEEVEREQGASSPSRTFLNNLLRIIVGNYIAFKSAMLNRTLRREGKFSSIFYAKIGADHCIFESIRYSKLRALYLKLNVISPTTLQGENAQFQGE